MGGLLLTRNLPKMNLIVLFLLISPTVIAVRGQGKYSKELNDWQRDDKPFRMQKLNLLWTKAQKMMSPEKLKLLNTELKMQDKEEVTWKRLKAEGQDKEGLKEAELRKSLRAIMNRYDLTGYLEDEEKSRRAERNAHNEATDTKDANAIFKDKKLNRLWIKAERAGFSEEELKTLKEEFQHHQEKLDEYYQFANSVPSVDEMSNSVENVDNKISKENSNSKQLLKEKHRQLKDDYDRLGKMAALGPEGKGFEEPKVNELWNLVLNANFSQSELDSLKEELRHYEHRVKKLHHFQSQVDLADASNKWNDGNADDKKRIEQKVKDYSHKVDKIHRDLEGRIIQRHMEL